MAIVLKGFGPNSSEVIRGFGGNTAYPTAVVYGTAAIDHMIIVYAEDRFLDIDLENRFISVHSENRFVVVEKR